jgi:hypothetical protein
MTDEARFDPERNVTTIADSRIVFHCHHYNIFLQRTVDEALGEDAANVQRLAALEASRRLLSGLFKGDGGAGVGMRVGVRERLDQATKLFGSLGFGLADLSGLTEQGGTVVLSTSHYALGWRAKFGPSAAPVCHFATGYWAAALAAAAGVAPERVLSAERRCGAVVDESCQIEIEVL